MAAPRVSFNCAANMYVFGLVHLKKDFSCSVSLNLVCELVAAQDDEVIEVLHIQVGSGSSFGFFFLSMCSSSNT